VAQARAVLCKHMRELHWRHHLYDSSPFYTITLVNQTTWTIFFYLKFFITFFFLVKWGMKLLLKWLDDLYTNFYFLLLHNIKCHVRMIVIFLWYYIILKTWYIIYNECNFIAWLYSHIYLFPCRVKITLFFLISVYKRSLIIKLWELIHWKYKWKLSLQLLSMLLYS
jgi:hypothetical protein